MVLDVVGVSRASSLKSNANGLRGGEDPPKLAHRNTIARHAEGAAVDLEVIDHHAVLGGHVLQVGHVLPALMKSGWHLQDHVTARLYAPGQAASNLMQLLPLSPESSLMIANLVRGSRFPLEGPLQMRPHSKRGPDHLAVGIHRLVLKLLELLGLIEEGLVATINQRVAQGRGPTILYNISCSPSRQSQGHSICKDGPKQKSAPLCQGALQSRGDKPFSTHRGHLGIVTILSARRNVVLVARVVVFPVSQTHPAPQSRYSRLGPSISIRPRRPASSINFSL